MFYISVAYPITRYTYVLSIFFTACRKVPQPHCYTVSPHAIVDAGYSCSCLDVPPTLLSLSTKASFTSHKLEFCVQCNGNVHSVTTHELKSHWTRVHYSTSVQFVCMP